MPASRAHTTCFRTFLFMWVQTLIVVQAVYAHWHGIHAEISTKLRSDKFRRRRLGLVQQHTIPKLHNCDEALSGGRTKPADVGFSYSFHNVYALQHSSIFVRKWSHKHCCRRRQRRSWKKSGETMNIAHDRQNVNTCYQELHCRLGLKPF